jgi:hypothetical protein
MTVHVHAERVFTLTQNMHKQEAHDREYLKIAKQTKDVNKWGMAVTAIGVVVTVALSQCMMKQ